MWYREYKDYPPDQPLVNERVETGKGIVGCEMHDLMGWGQTYHKPPKSKKRGILRTLLSLVFRVKYKDSSRGP